MPSERPAEARDHRDRCPGGPCYGRLLSQRDGDLLQEVHRFLQSPLDPGVDVRVPVLLLLRTSPF